jgi:hypothetical protein
MLSRDDILKAEDITYDEVDVPEWGGTVRLRGLTGLERDTWEASNRLLKGSEYVPNPRGAKARLLVRAIVDAEGARLFRDQDAGALGARSAAVLERLFDRAAELSGLTDDAVGSAEGNSEDTPDDASPSGWPETSD